MRTGRQHQIAHLTKRGYLTHQVLAPGALEPSKHPIVMTRALRDVLELDSLRKAYVHELSLNSLSLSDGFRNEDSLEENFEVGSVDCYVESAVSLFS